MTTIWIVIFLLLASVLALSLVVAGLARQIGILHERSAPLGALVTRNVGLLERVPPGPWETVLGSSVTLPLTENRHTLLMFVSTTCPVCKKLLPIISDMRKSEADRVEFVFASDGPVEDHLRFYRKNKLDSYTYILSSQLGKMLAVDHLPYMVLLKTNGDIVSRGLVNSREQIESLITAAELGHPTIQSFLSSQANIKSDQGHEHHDTHI